MHRAIKKLDKQLIILTALMVLLGFFIFSSASLGLLARSGSNFISTAISQLVLGVGVGTVLLLFTSKINYRFWKKIALPLFIVAIIFTTLVFIPGLGITAGGATRWINLHFFTFQPAEFLKIATVLFAASYLAKYRSKLSDFRFGLLAIVAIIAVPAVVLLAQPDTGTIAVIGASIGTMFIASGAKWRDIFALLFSAILALAILAFLRPYVFERLMTFVNPGENGQTSGYQVNQSLIAVGSGQLFGRGFGQSVQKFNYLPEPTTDSVFAVAAEEFGFFGASTLIVLFMLFFLRTLRISTRAPDYFGGLVALGLSVLIVFQALLNIAAMLGVAPLTGIPLPFISHGGTAMAVMLASVGMILNVSRFAKA